MINAILHNLKKPHKIPLLLLQIYIFLQKKNYKFENFKIEQNNRFKLINLDRISIRKS